MAITINGSGTITGASTLATAVASPTLTTPNIDSAQIPTVSGTAPLYMCRAWVNFNGTGTPAIRGSGNVSSITDNATGDYTVNFTTAMSDVNYAVNASAGTNTLTTPVQVGYFKPNFSPVSNAYVAPTTSAVRLGMIDSSSYDVQHAYVSIFR